MLPDDPDEDEDGPPLALERLRSASTTIVVVLIALLVVTIGVSTSGLVGPARPLVFVAVLVVVGLAVAFRSRFDDRDYGPGAGGDDDLD